MDIEKYLNLEYPYLYLQYKLDKDSYLKHVKNFKPIIYDYIPEEIKKYNVEKYMDKYFIIKDIYLKTFVINSITDYFTEKIRIQCIFGENDSPKQYWRKNKKNIIQKTIDKYNKINILLIREILFQNTRFCNNFRISVALVILKLFNAKNWLDISAGWGDRLMAAILHNIDMYVSCDPNLDLHKYYDKIIDTFAPNQKNKFIIYKNGFIEAPIQNNIKFDLVFSSPPFFTLEKYSKFDQDSITMYNDEVSWTQNFLIKSLIKSYNLLNKYGHIVLYIEGSKYLLNQIKKLNNIMNYKGIIYFFEKKPRTMYVWQKINDDLIYDL